MFKKFAVAAIFATLASSSFAADNRSFYAGADIGTTRVDEFSDRGTSFGGFIGYQFHANFAVEAGYRRLGDLDQNFPGAGGGINVNLALDQAAVSMIGIIPLPRGFRLYGRLGHNQVEGKASSGSFSATEKQTGALYGVGVDYAITPAMSARLEVQKPGSDTTNVSAGIAFRF